MKYDKKHEAEDKRLIKKGDKSFIKHEKAEVKAAEKNVKKNVKKGK